MQVVCFRGEGDPRTYQLGIEEERLGRKASRKGYIIKQVGTVGTWSSIPLGTGRGLCKTHLRVIPPKRQGNWGIDSPDLIVTG